MGQINCSICSGLEKEKEYKTEVDFRDDFINKKAHQSQFSEALPSSIITLDKIKQKEVNVIKIQALWRGYKIRKLCLLKPKKREYFQHSYTDSKYHDSAKNYKREARDAFNFKNGAVYTGEWLGEFRDGYGVQVWPDGAQYKGNWYNNKADGFGRFFHVDGDRFEGNWKIDKANGKGVYFHMNGAKYEGD